MDRRKFLRSFAAGALALPAAAAARKPNIIIVLADDMGYADVGFTGVKDIRTPNIDRIAHEGVTFTNGYVSHPFCSPTRAGLMTGRYQQRFGHENNPLYDPSDPDIGLPLTETLLPQFMRKAGYRTGIIGKWHLGATPKHHPMARGFEEQYGFIGGGHDYFTANPAGEKREYFIPIERNGKPVELKEYLSDAFSREAVSFIHRHAKEPLFLYLAYNAPHTPQQVTDKYLDPYANIPDEKRRKYAGMIQAVDEGVRGVLQALKEEKLDEDTLVFFFSDNGGPIAVNGSSNQPYRGAKGQVYDGGIHVPFAARWKGRIPAGEIYKQPVISLDVFATATALAGTLPSNIDGVNLIPYVTGETSKPPHERLFWRTGGGATYAVREGRYKLVKIGAQQPELYDLETDPSEANNIAASNLAVLARLENARVEWNKQLRPPLFQSPKPAAKKKK
jgi:arylsulfatase A-like enzyme